MTYLAMNPSENEIHRELRTTVRMPDQTASRLFQGWGPKF
jgi:hypothetical protein